MSSRARFWAARVAIAMVMAAALLIARSESSSAATFTVTTPFDSGAGSLREAITRANQTAGLDTIAFDIPSFDSVAAGPGRVIQLVTPSRPSPIR